MHYRKWLITTGSFWLVNLFIPKLIIIKKALFSFYGLMKFISVQAAMKKTRESDLLKILTPALISVSSGTYGEEVKYL